MSLSFDKHPDYKHYFLLLRLGVTKATITQKIQVNVMHRHGHWAEAHTHTCMGTDRAQTLRGGDRHTVVSKVATDSERPRQPDRNTHTHGLTHTGKKGFTQTVPEAHPLRDDRIRGTAITAI